MKLIVQKYYRAILTYWTERTFQAGAKHWNSFSTKKNGASPNTWGAPPDNTLTTQGISVRLPLHGPAHKLKTNNPQMNHGRLNPI